jgi:hypothetical protein
MSRTNLIKIISKVLNHYNLTKQIKEILAKTILEEIKNENQKRWN